MGFMEIHVTVYCTRTVCELRKRKIPHQNSIVYSGKMFSTKHQQTPGYFCPVPIHVHAMPSSSAMIYHRCKYATATAPTAPVADASQLFRMRARRPCTADLRIPVRVGANFTPANIAWYWRLCVASLGERERFLHIVARIDAGTTCCARLPDATSNTQRCKIYAWRHRIYSYFSPILQLEWRIRMDWFLLTLRSIIAIL